MNQATSNKGTYFIRPAGRHILTIGRDLIKDSYAAIVELVKNSYDADAKNVTITFEAIEKDVNNNSEEKSEKSIQITINDDGHGMGFNTVIGKWMVPSTNDKLERKYSPAGRQMQGRKGIGRYAAAILGDELFLETVDKSSKKTTLYVDWIEFEKSKYIDNVEILIESIQTTEPSGTTIQIVGNTDRLNEWSIKEIGFLRKELRKLISPEKSGKDKFSITLKFKNFPVDGFNNNEFIIEPFPLIELYDYNLTAEIVEKDIRKLSSDRFINKEEFISAKHLAQNSDSLDFVIAEVTFKNKAEKGIPQEHFMTIINFEKGIYCGKVSLDLRVFDKEPDAIESLIKKGLKDPDTGQFLGKRETSRLLKEMSGVGVYRGGFRIRPLGDPGNEWLELDNRRVQNPSKCIGNDQIIGFVNIQPEEESHLEEKSARDGLKENKYYDGLKEVVIKMLTFLEERRFEFREKTGRGRKASNIEKELKNLFDFGQLNRKITTSLKSLNLPTDKLDEVRRLIQETEQEKLKLLDTIKETVALYQGHTTLGKIIMVIQHEGRKPLAYLKNQSSVIIEHIKRVKRNYDEELFEKIKTNLQGIKEQVVLFINLFNRLDPLSVKRRGRRRVFHIEKVINDVFKVFENEIKNNNIAFSYSCESNIVFDGWQEDFYITLTNLIENSIYWLSQSHKKAKKIDIKVLNNENDLIIDCIDNGVGIEERYIDSGIIFEPGFSTKPDGTGLGLAIAGEAIQRNKGMLKAIYDKNGAYFRIEFSPKDEEIQ